jgi:hypothetical protein
MKVSTLYPVQGNKGHRIWHPTYEIRPQRQTLTATTAQTQSLSQTLYLILRRGAVDHRGLVGEEHVPVGDLGIVTPAGVRVGREVPARCDGAPGV